MRAKMITLAAAMAVLGGAAPSAGGNPAPVITADMGTSSALSVLTYNVKGLPWPVARGRTADLAAIGNRLASLRILGRQPHIVALQEAFTGEAKAIGVRGGYSYRVIGPSADAAQSTSSGSIAESLSSNGSWLKGETEGHMVDSGLMLLSDYPIIRVQRAAFPLGACAGYDCLANKGVLLVTVSIPGIAQPVDVLTTHLNSRHASGVSDARSLSAYTQQVQFLGRFVRAHHDPDHPLIMAGDFNVGSAPGRLHALSSALAGLSSGRGRSLLRPALARAMQNANLNRRAQADADWTLQRARDWQFVSDGQGSAVEVSGMAIPFGTSARGETLSDHMGFTIDYRSN